LLAGKKILKVVLLSVTTVTGTAVCNHLSNAMNSIGLTKLTINILPKLLTTLRTKCHCHCQLKLTLLICVDCALFLFGITCFSRLPLSFMMHHHGWLILTLYSTIQHAFSYQIQLVLILFIIEFAAWNTMNLKLGKTC